MANTAVTSTNVVKLVKDTAVALAAPQAVTTGNVAVLTPQAAAGVNDNSFAGRYLLVQMTESGAVATSVATPKAGVTGGTPANQAKRGDGTPVTFTSGQVKYLQLDLARYLQADGTVQIAVSGASGSVSFNVVQLDPSA